MIKKVAKEQLQLGMFIHDLKCGWMDHSFLRNSFMLRKEGDLERILQSGIADVLIDTIKGIDVAGPPQPILEATPALPPRIPTPATATTTHQEELGFAKQIQHEANKLITDVLHDVRMGKQIQVERLNPVVGQITDSILRNPGTLVSLCRIREGDTYTFNHSVSVCALLVSFCRFMEMSPEVIHEAGIGGMLHDIGKMRVPDHILNKPGKLTDAEFAIMKKHADLGIETLQQTPGISRTVMQIAGEHHERFAGNGYPYGLDGPEISLLGRMAAIVDVYDALTSNRIYHKGREPAEVLGLLVLWSDPSKAALPHLDLELVYHFIKSVGIYPVGSLVRLDSQRLAVVIDQNGHDQSLYPKVRVIYDIRRERALTPEDLDLSAPESAGDSILGGEDPETWKVDPFSFLTLPL